MELLQIDRMLEEKGFIDEPVDPKLRLMEEINRLKKDKNAIILSHFYVEGELQDIADLQPRYFLVKANFPLC